jgi:tetratricopeptide (TPR) repeat protein
MPGSSVASPAQLAARTPDELKQHGLREFRQKHYGVAIAAWQKIENPNDRLKAALAEAHFRQAAQLTTPADVLYSLQRAAVLMPADAIYAYYLGLALHRQGQVSASLEQYKRAVANGLTRYSAGIAIAVAALELDPATDLSALPGVTDEHRRALAPLVALLHGRAMPRSDTEGQREQLNTMKVLLSTSAGRELPNQSQFALNVLDAMVSGDTAGAQQALPGIEVKGIPRELDALRWYYAGVAAAANGDMLSAEKWWREAQRLNSALSGPGMNLATVHALRAQALAETGNRAEAAQVILEGLHAAAGNPALSALALVEINHLARQAVLAGDWVSARDHWANVRSVLEHFDPKGAFGKSASARPIVHNLALAYEANQQWQEAAEAWRAMLRSRPRRDAVDGYSGAHWMWVRKQVIECYKKASDLPAAITMFRQALKASPDDVELRLELVDALRANEQDSSAENELHRLLEKRPDNVDALKTLAEVHLDREAWYMAQQTMRRALMLEPDNPDLRKRMAHILIESGSDANDNGRLDSARELLNEASSYAPDDYNIPIMLARVEFNARNVTKAQEYLERALDLGKVDPDAYLQACICWIVEQNIDQARDVIARAEVNGQVRTSVFLGAGMEAVTRAEPSEVGFGLFDFFMGEPASAPRRPRSEKQAALALWGRELLDRAVQAGPELEILLFISARFVASGLSGGASYARRLTERSPDDPHVWMMFGMLLGYERQVKEAQDVFRKAAQLARKQGDTETAHGAEEMRRVVTDPAFTMLVRMSIASAQDELHDFDF